MSPDESPEVLIAKAIAGLVSAMQLMPGATHYPVTVELPAELFDFACPQCRQPGVKSVLITGKSDPGRVNPCGCMIRVAAFPDLLDSLKIKEGISFLQIATFFADMDKEGLFDLLPEAMKVMVRDKIYERIVSGETFENGHLKARMDENGDSHFWFTAGALAKCPSCEALMEEIFVPEVNCGLYEHIQFAGHHGHVQPCGCPVEPDALEKIQAQVCPGQ